METGKLVRRVLFQFSLKRLLSDEVWFETNDHLLNLTWWQTRLMRAVRREMDDGRDG
jgi:hypothetical protein